MGKCAIVYYKVIIKKLHNFLNNYTKIAHHENYTLIYCTQNVYHKRPSNNSSPFPDTSPRATLTALLPLISCHTNRVKASGSIRFGSEIECWFKSIWPWISY